MTVDELIQLTEHLAGKFDMVMLVEGAYANDLTSAPPGVVALLVRFLTGERPTGAAAPTVTGPYVDLGDVKTVVPIDEEQATFVDVPARNVADRRDENGRLILGGEFAGIELP